MTGNMTWTPLSPAQMRAMGRLGKLRDAPPKFITAYDRDTSQVIVVPASTKDRRRWDITKGGRITRSVR